MHEPTTLTKILEERGKTYGPFIDNAKVAQNLKDVVEGDKTCILYPDMREAIDVICSKIARIVTGDPTYIDNWDDIAGYATLVANRLRKDKDVEAPAEEAR